ncbi:MAG: bifunctional demethylmenaquinone methyltransferase/2-methoxy-6-polyprenyl-1,4-benzoquinol methylase UbiE [Myxococcaceae bacterium]|nr:bifunctional demethylmenaquinone methyltransferase/2-methoxy-6-polyprenyl-1,4-benzoquinol methylase UbiE [Myxococcaceae bacterium]MBH2006206.1 bifunctional demethylmenaquinone methyltransferase/2-methoxy-6-polyprenyl-1,4-benzoquinol methylase UbiE [Myxococcaceae bacterium]
MVHALFNQIAPKYDLLNRLLSFGQDQLWRKKVASLLPESSNLHILDVATGTADLAIQFFSQNHPAAQVIGIDMAEQMLRFGQSKIERLGLSEQIHLEPGDAQNLRFEDHTFDVVTSAFGLRNMPNREQALAEMMRVLKPNGRLIVLEFSLPPNALIRLFYLFYFRHILPYMGGLISGDYQAYRYLNRSVEEFSEKVFHKMRRIPLCFGVATIYVTDKLAS